MTTLASNSTSSSQLPSYKNPPVNEVVCGMRFDTSEKFRITHLGFLWDKFRSEYPNIQHAPPITSSKGEFVVDAAIGMPIPRVWFINKKDDQLVQFQVDRFYFNWRRRQGDYPRYSHVIKNFESVLNTITNFFNEFELGEFRPIEYELSYINHIPKGQGWNTIDDLPNIFSDFVWKQTKERFLPNPLKVAWSTEFMLQENQGRLIVNLKEATRIEDKTPLLVLELKAIGEDAGNNKDAILNWFNIAHKWIVKGFTDLTTPAAHKIWERE